MEQFANSAQTTLNGAITSTGATSLTVISGATFPATGTFRIQIDTEIIIVGIVSGNTWSNLTRGAEGSTAATHGNGATVTFILTAGALAQMKSDILGEVAELIAGGAR
jgi:hypothetical protein